jgi:uncharacterized protein YndB with AHSA1/START domain
MSATTKHQTEIIVPEGLPIIELKREFDAPVDRVFRAWVDPDLFVQWIGPRSIDTRIDEWDCSTGGHWRYTAGRDAEAFGFYGSFHEVRENERIVQTFTFDGAPDSVALEIMSFESLPDGRSRIHSVSVGESVEDRDAMVASGMETGIVEGFEKLDELLAR